MPNQEPAFAWPFGNGLVRVGTQGLFHPCLKTFVATFLPARLTAPGSPRICWMKWLVSKETRCQSSVQGSEVQRFSHKSWTTWGLYTGSWLFESKDFVRLWRKGNAQTFGSPIFSYVGQSNLTTSFGLNHGLIITTLQKGYPYCLNGSH